MKLLLFLTLLFIGGNCYAQYSDYEKYKIITNDGTEKIVEIIRQTRENVYVRDVDGHKLTIPRSEIKSRTLYNNEQELNKNNTLPLGIKSINNQLDSLQYAMDYNRYCMGKFYSGYMRGISFQIVGFAATVAGSVISAGDDTRTGGAILLGGTILSITGTIMSISSHRWMKKAYIGPTRYGVGLTIPF